MSATQKRTISLPDDQARFIDAEVAAGDYASASEVVQAGIQALEDRDEAIERWLIEEVVPTYDAMMADPSRAIPIDEVFAQIEARHKRRLASR